jgi:hypothetical protein
LIKWLRRDEWREGFEDLLNLHFGSACAKADIEIDDLASLIGADVFMNLWGCVFEDFLTREDEAGNNIVDDYLKRRGWKESVPDKTYMAGLRVAVMSLYEVSDIVPGESFLARDLVRGGNPIRVSERTASRQLKPWDRIGARIVQLPSKNIIGGGLLPFHHDLGEDVLKSLRQAFREARKDTAKRAQKHGYHADVAEATDILTETVMLKAAAPLFTGAWLGDALDRALNPRMPELRNSEDDELLFTTVRYPLAPGATHDAVRAVLGNQAALQQESDAFWNWLDDNRSARAQRAKPSSPGRRLLTTTGDGRLVLGNVELTDKALTLSVNSYARAERGQAMLGPALAGLVRSPLVVTETIEQLMASQTASMKTPSSGLSPDEERAVTQQSLDRQYMKMLDEKVPMLGNKTPMQAAKTAKGREKLAAWLKYIENQLAKQPVGAPMADYDVHWLWEKLGIADLRC